MLRFLGRLWREGYLTLMLCFVGRIAGLGTLALGIFCREHDSGQYIVAGVVILGMATLLRWLVTGFYDCLWDNIPMLRFIEQFWSDLGVRRSKNGKS